LREIDSLAVEAAPGGPSGPPRPPARMPEGGDSGPAQAGLVAGRRLPSGAVSTAQPGGL